ncbi:hypothetical protein PEBR_11429 [Penicillium brasilianum]|uniref:Uncharacterized protein n=1 Tax=Penicillium brasilianum TaxID=104259 RepID=A0A1S9RTC6_PENBI|nr:hypothetical protein PEBR_11429 [Penicillium brasilianum]
MLLSDGSLSVSADQLSDRVTTTWEDDEDEGEGDGEPKKTDGLSPCDFGKTCLCKKLVEEHPDHPYSFSRGGIQKFTTTSIFCDLRNPDTFEMYIYNDFYGYGLMVEDGEGLEILLHVVGTIFLTMMATLERLDLLKPDFEIKNIGMIMGLAIRLNAYAVDLESFEDLPKYLNAYAAKHKIVLHDVPKDSGSEEPVPATGKGSLSEPTAKKNDPWGFALELKKLKKEQPLGGDKFDITTVSGPERKSAHFDGKDPLTKQAIKALKEGLVMQLA